MGEQIIVIGGGVIGLSCAFELQSRGHQVTVLESDRCGGQASGAAAGMLAPFSENVEGPDDFFRLCLESLRLYPKWQETIKQASRFAFAYENSGSLYVAAHEADLLALEGRRLWQSEYGASACLIEGGQLFGKEPLLSRNVVAALHIPEESHVYAPHYVKALELACRLIGVVIHEHLERVDVISWKQEVRVQAAAGSAFSAAKLIICSGAWARQLEEALEIRIPIYPIRGQICSYDAADEPIRHMVFSSQGYLVSKDNGTIVCGASEDIAGFDSSVTEKGIERLRKWNKAVFPFLEERTPIHRWAGLRPATQDGFPLIGALQEAEHVIMAAGHYRNGILLSPITAKMVADMAEGTAVPAFVKAFRPERFSL